MDLIVLFREVVGHISVGGLQEIALDVIDIALPQGGDFVGVLHEGGNGERPEIMGRLYHCFDHGLALGITAEILDKGAVQLYKIRM